MATIKLGIGTSHGPMLSMPPDMWTMRASADRLNQQLYFRGGRYSFDDLVSLRKEEGIAEKLTPSVMRERFIACQVAMDGLGKTIADAELDVMLVIGNDQKELFTDKNMPALSIYTGPTFDHVPPSPAQIAKLSPDIAAALPGRYPPEPMEHRADAALSAHVVDHLIEVGYDIATSRTLPPGNYGDRGIPHAFGFVYTRLLRNNLMPQVLIFINTFYPPNQPTLKRCFNLGQEIAMAVEAWPGEIRVGVIGSGGLSHYVLDEDLDSAVLTALTESDWHTLLEMPEELFRSGSSEIKNWVALAGAMSRTSLKIEILDYVACYRSEAGTGNGMGFARWH